MRGLVSGGCFGWAVGGSTGSRCKLIFSAGGGCGKCASG